MKKKVSYLFVLLLLSVLITPVYLTAHCDSMDGPLIKEALEALKTKNVNLVLKWVKKEKEKEIKDVFNKVMKVSGESKVSKEISERYFLETLVRIHREGEGAPYTGIKMSGSYVDPAVKKGDASLETGSVDKLAGLLSGKVKQIILKRFKKALLLRSEANKNSDKGREYVKAYVEYIHFIENLHTLLKDDNGGHKH